MIYTQIYSLQYPDEALACVEAGADRIGVLVGSAGGKYPCACTEEQAKEIFEAVGDKAVKILISVLPDPEDIIAQTKRLKPDVLHLCAEYDGDPQFRKRLNEEVPGVLLMEAVGVGTDPKAIDEAVYKATFADILILDSVSTTVPGVGAAGVTHDWTIDAEIVKRVNVPVIEAGGLGPDNVAAAIEAIHPWAVDSLTKTSIKENGVLVRKDIEKVRQFCEIAHRY
ncbi:MAG: phosphoribosylanthranilate isomerase [Parasporobacterium sp.]|nr:phosphoribosylanthranilate isomerase [Parasporobacterium sp.]